MNLHQLRYVLEIVRHGNHLSAAAESLNASQPAVSRQIQLLEAELGFSIFERTRNRIIGLTQHGQQVYEIAKRVSTDVDALRELKEDVSSGQRGTLVVATTHTQARYMLPKAIQRFLKSYPDVQIILKQGDADEIRMLVDAGEADLAIGARTSRRFPELVSLPLYELSRSVVARLGHPILEAEPLTLEAIARYPLIAYDHPHRGSRLVMESFDAAGLTPKVVLSAIDADVCKTYIELGLGISIFVSAAFDPARDVGLGERKATHLFPASSIHVMLRANSYLRPFALDFIKEVAPHLTPAVVRKAVDQPEELEEIDPI